MCKCENCKNMDPNSGKPGGCGEHGTALEESDVALDTPASATANRSIKTNARSFEMFNNGDDDIYEGSSDEDEAKRFANPRKQYFNEEKSPSGIFHDDEGRDGDKNKKAKDKKRKGSTVGQPKTPTTSYNDSQRKKLDFTPSPEKQSLSGGRARRNVRPFGHLNPDFEIGK